MAQQTPTTDLNSLDRLPCRGCTPDCAYLLTCEGKPWRADVESLVPAPGSSTTARSKGADS